MKISFSLLEILCPGLDAPANGTVDVPSRTVGSMATYSCDDGFRLVDGSTTRTCEENGQWTGLQPTCEGDHNE